MTKNEAVDYLSKYVDGYYSEINEAVRLAVAALQTQIKAEQNEPLTLDELRKMEGEPIWLEFVNQHAHSKYRIVRGLSDNAVVFEEYDNEFGPYNSVYLGHYGRIWLAYRHKPMEGQDTNKTNADKIRAMNDVELANFLQSVHDDPCDNCCDNLYWCRRNNAPEPICKKHFLTWLQAEVIKEETK